MRSHRLDHQLAVLAERLERIEGMLLLKDPGAAKAAEAYEGLRRQVVASTAERVAHLADLARLDAAVRAGESTASLALLLSDLLVRAGLERRDDPALPDAFDIPAEAAGRDVDIVEPAYVEAHTGRVVRQGRAVPAGERSRS